PTHYSHTKLLDLALDSPTMALNSPTMIGCGGLDCLDRHRSRRPTAARLTFFDRASETMHYVEWHFRWTLLAVSIALFLPGGTGVRADAQNPGVDADLPTQVIHYGEEKPLPKAIPLRAGPLTMIYEAGDLRYIKLGEH